MTDTTKELGNEQLVSEVIRAHSRSFSIAAKFLPREVRANVEKLYAWCRACDDSVDLAGTREEARGALQELFDDLDRIEQGLSPNQNASVWIRDLHIECGIEIEDARDLLKGMEMDLEDIRIRDEQHLLDYAYHVAGVVGVMMCRVMGVSDPAARAPAISLGIGMQLTNIARDVLEDADRNRSYLPGIANPKTRDKSTLKRAVAEVLLLADTHYAKAQTGLKYLPNTCRRSIAVAATLYREIGLEIRRQDFDVLRGRIIVPKWRLIACILSLSTSGFKQRLLKRVQIRDNAFINNKIFFHALENQMKDARYLAYLGVSLTAFMATALFLMLYMNPKDASYSWLPLLYAGISAVIAVVTNYFARRQLVS